MDGSYKDGHGTAAFRIQNDLGDQITGCNITPGLQEHHLAYRSELGGIVGILVLLDLLQQHYDLPIHQCVITCDCNGAGLKSLTYHRPLTANNDNNDLLTERTRSRPKQQSTQCIGGGRASSGTIKHPTTGQIRSSERRNGQTSKPVQGTDKTLEPTTATDYFRPRMDYMDCQPENHRRYPQHSQTTHTGNRNEQMA
jgi:hypothetical protein